MKLGLVQQKQNQLYDFAEDDKLSLETKEELSREMTDRAVSLVEKAAQAGCDLIVTTEGINFVRPNCKDKKAYEKLIPCLPYDEVTFQPKEPATGIFKKLEEIAAEYNCYIVVGLINRRESWHNSAITYGPDGKVKMIYDKIQLAGDEKKIYEAGKSVKYVDTEFGRVGCLICYDMQFPELSRTLAKEDVDLIVAPTWGWEWIYGPCRAYENGIYVASAMSVPYKGRIEGLRKPSQVVSPSGDIIAEGSDCNEEVVIANIDICSCKKYREARISEICRNFNSNTI